MFTEVSSPKGRSEEGNSVNRFDISSSQNRLVDQHQKNTEKLRRELADSLGKNLEEKESVIQSTVKETLMNSDSSEKFLKTEDSVPYSSTQRWKPEERTGKPFLNAVNNLLLLAGGSRELPESVINASVNNPPPPQIQSLDSLPIETQDHFCGEEGSYARVVHPFVEFPVTEEILDELVSITTEETRKIRYKNFFYPVSVYQSLPESFPIDTAELELTTVEGKQVAEIMKESLIELLGDARDAGYYPYLRSGFRSIETQENVFENNGRDSDVSAPPGNSEHHLGLAIDILERGDSWNDSREKWNEGFYKWLRDNCWQFGFVISYPTGDNMKISKDSSGYNSAEPWHLRYVGSEMAEFMYKELQYLDPDSPYTVNNVLAMIWERLEHSPTIRY